MFIYEDNLLIFEQTIQTHYSSKNVTTWHLLKNPQKRQQKKR
jgi:ethanolamine utilization microcompartment shell protein EutS